MSKLRVLVASGMFIGITMVKLIAPSMANSLREEILPVISQDVDYKTAAVELGSYITNRDGDLSAALAALLASPSDTAGVELSAFPDTLVNVPSASPSPTPTPTPTPEPTPSPTPEAITTFLESQAAFSDYEVPENVSYEMPTLPFEFALPVSGTTSDGFGYRLHPIQDTVKFHYGTDYAVVTGTSIGAFANGTVAEAGEASGYGLYVLIDHLDGYQTLYAHCSSLKVSAGDVVSIGDVIALSGATGEVTGPHLHFELICDDVYYNPEFYTNTYSA